MKNSTTPIAFITAISLHLIIGGVLLMTADFSLSKVKPKEVPSIIEASVVSQQMFDDLAQRKANKILAEKQRKEKIRQQEARKKAEIKRQQVLRQQQAAERVKVEKAKILRQQQEKQRIEAQKVRAAEALKQEKIVAKQKQAAKVKAANVAKQKADKIVKEKAQKAAKIKAAKEAKIKAVKAAKIKAQQQARIKAAAVAAEKERLRLAELDKQMEAEFSDDFSNAQSAKQLSEIARYEALIRMKISRYWKVDPSMNGKSCTLAIKLAPDGLVLSAQMSRGDRNLCASARRATLQAKTLPIPKDIEIAPKFRDFDITLQPDL